LKFLPANLDEYAWVAIFLSERDLALRTMLVKRFRTEPEHVVKGFDGGEVMIFRGKTTNVHSR
ncbi:MAG TPA: hypothetical protein VFV64_04015, partial [Permianibacter sp.]|nr:hypothetical protein [Permianibacter sp.]